MRGEILGKDWPQQKIDRMVICSSILKHNILLAGDQEEPPIQKQKQM